MPAVINSMGQRNKKNKNMEGSNIPVFLFLQPQESSQTESMTFGQADEDQWRLSEAWSSLKLQCEERLAECHQVQAFIGWLLLFRCADRSAFPWPFMSRFLIMSLRPSKCLSSLPSHSFFFPEQYSLSSKSYKSALVWATSLMLVTHWSTRQ